MPSTFAFQPLSELLPDIRRYLGGTGAATDAQWPNSSLYGAVNDAISEMQNFLDDVDTQFMLKQVGLWSGGSLGAYTSPDGSVAYPIYQYVLNPGDPGYNAQTATQIRFNIFDFRKAVTLVHKPTFTYFKEIPRGTLIQQTGQVAIVNVPYFSITKGEFTIPPPGGPNPVVGEMWVALGGYAPDSGALVLEYSFYHDRYVDDTDLNNPVQMQPSYYPLFKLWVALKALAKLPMEQARIQMVLTQMGMQRIPGHRMSFSETDAYSNMLSALIGRREPPTVPAQ